MSTGVPSGAGDRVVRDAGYLSIESARSDGRCLVRLRGELDCGTVAPLEDELRKTERADAATVVVDLSGLEFIDAGGIRTLLRAADRGAANGHPVRFVRGEAHVQRTLHLAGVEGEFNFLD